MRFTRRRNPSGAGEMRIIHPVLLIDGWRGYEIDELGGTLHVNGAPWEP